MTTIMTIKDYYSNLGINKNATEKDIKNAFWKLAIKWHPDKHPEKDKLYAHNNFIPIAEAYEVLKNKEKRNDYNKLYEFYYENRIKPNYEYDEDIRNYKTYSHKANQTAEEYANNTYEEFINIALSLAKDIAVELLSDLPEMVSTAIKAVLAMIAISAFWAFMLHYFEGSYIGAIILLVASYIFIKYIIKLFKD